VTVLDRTDTDAVLPEPFARWFASRGWAPRAHQLELLAKARAGRSVLLIAPSAALMAPLAASGSARAGNIGGGQNQALRFVAIRFVEFPMAAEIHARGRPLFELFARTRCNTKHRQGHDDSHPKIL
jgi:hypothetical protein